MQALYAVITCPSGHSLPGKVGLQVTAFYNQHDIKVPVELGAASGVNESALCFKEERCSWASAMERCDTIGVFLCVTPTLVDASKITHCCTERDFGLANACSARHREQLAEVN